MDTECAGRCHACRLRAAAELAAAVAVTGDVTQLYGQVAERAVGLFDAEWAAVRVYDEARGRLVIRAMAGPSPHVHVAELAPGEGLAGSAFSSGRPVVSNDFPSFSRGQAPFEGTQQRAGIAVPLRRAAQVMGTLTINTRQQARYDRDDVAVLDLFGCIVSTAIERAEAQCALAQRAERLRVLHAIALTLAHESDPERVLDLIVHRARTLAGVDHAVVWLWVPEERRFHATAHAGYEGGLPTDRLAEGEGTVGHTFAIGWPHVVDDYQAWPGATGFRAAGLRSTLTVPLSIAMWRFGVISLGALRPRGFSSADTELLALFAQQAATALLHARTLAAERAVASQKERLATLHALATEVVREQHEATVLARTVEAAARLLGCGVARLWLVDQASGEFVVAASHGADRVPLRPRYQRSMLRLLDAALERKAVIAVEDFASHAGALREAIDHGVASVIVAPLLGDGGELGVLAGISLTPRHWPTEDHELLGLLAQQATEALLNARGLMAREHASKLDAALRMARTAADRVVNPLAVASGNLELLLHRFGSEVPRHGLATEALAACLQASAEVHRLQSVVRIVERDDGELATLDLEAGSHEAP